jgi:hypothetical protein
MNLHMWEDALEHCDEALELDKKHRKTLYRSAKCLAFLFKFDLSINLLKSL